MAAEFARFLFKIRLGTVPFNRKDIVKRSQLVSGADSVNMYTGVNLLNQEMFLDNKTNSLCVLGF